MKKNVFYVLRGEVPQSRFNKSGVLEIFEVFNDPNPALARQRAFRCYQNFVEVFLNSCGKDYSTHEQTVKDLHDFLFPWSKAELDSTISLIDMTGELKVLMILDQDVIFKSKSGVVFYKNEFEIHGITNDSNNFYCQKSFFKNLRLEYKIYDKFTINTEDKAISYDISGLFEEAIMANVLPTPIDFNKMLSDYL